MQHAFWCSCIPNLTPQTCAPSTHILKIIQYIYGIVVQKFIIHYSSVAFRHLTLKHLTLLLHKFCTNFICSMCIVYIL